MSSINPDRNLTPAEVDDLERLELLARDGLRTYVQVGDALAEIRDRQLYRGRHGSFEAYLRERWGVSIPGTALGSKPCQELAKACEQTLSALDGEDRLGVEIRLAVRGRGEAGAPANGQGLDPSVLDGAMGEELIPTLRWLLTQAGGTIGAVAHQLESRAADIDDRARAQLRDDVLFLDGELAVVKGLLAGFVDWDSELRRLLDDELPPLYPDTDPGDDK